MNKSILKAADILNHGGIIIYPTDTAFGIGCRIDDHKAVDRLFALRNRPLTHATPILVSSVQQALEYYDSPSNIVRHLIQKYWPGALTVVSLCKKNVLYSPIRGNGDTVGIRMPNNANILQLLSLVKVPIIGTSANFSGGKTPYKLHDLDSVLVSQVDMVLGGTCSIGSESTVIDCSKAVPKILRQGSIFPEMEIAL